MNHEEYEILLSMQLDGDLTPAEENRLREHLARCPQCRSLQREFQRSQFLLQSMGENPPDGFMQRVLDRLEPQASQNRRNLKRRAAPWLAAAAVFALVMLGVVHPDLPFADTQNDGIYQEEAAAEDPDEPEEYPEEAVESAEETEPSPDRPGNEQPTEPAAEATAGPPASDQKAEPAKNEQSSAGSGGKKRTESSSFPSGQPASGKEAPAAAIPAESGETEASPPPPSPSDDTAEAIPFNSVSDEGSADAPQSEVTMAGGGEPPEAAREAMDPTQAEEAEPESHIMTDVESETLTWQQAAGILTEYLQKQGVSDPAVTALGLSESGESWLFSFQDTESGELFHYSVSRETGEVTRLS